MRRIPGLIMLTGAALVAGGCPPELFDNALPTTMDEIDAIRNDSSLASDEIRAQLENLGIPPSTVNALLRDVRRANQYGGSPLTAYNKVIWSQFTTLTPDEVQIYGDGASNVSDEDDLDIELSDAEAQAIVTFLQANGLDSAQELETFLDTPGNEVPPDIPEGVLEALFVDFDPELLLPSLP